MATPDQSGAATSTPSEDSHHIGTSPADGKLCIEGQPMKLVTHGHRLIMTVAACLLLPLAGCSNRDSASQEWRIGVVNVNSADVPTLTLLPGIRTSAARRVVDYRSANGRFKAPVELILVRGIGERCFEQIQPYVVTDGTTTLTERVRLPRGPGTVDACR